MAAGEEILDKDPKGIFADTDWHVVQDAAGKYWRIQSVNLPGFGSGGDMYKGVYDLIGIEEQILGVFAAQEIYNKEIDADLNNLFNIDLTRSVINNLPIEHLAGGVNASSSTVLHGDNTWKVPQQITDHSALQNLDKDTHQQYSLIIVGNGAPQFTPSRRGLTYIDAQRKYSYISVGIASENDWKRTDGGGDGGGGMDPDIYDPNNRATDVFDMGNMVENTNGPGFLILTQAERDAIGGIPGGMQELFDDKTPVFGGPVTGGIKLMGDAAPEPYNLFVEGGESSVAGVIIGGGVVRTLPTVEAVFDTNMSPSKEMFTLVAGRYIYGNDSGVIRVVDINDPLNLVEVFVTADYTQQTPPENPFHHFVVSTNNKGWAGSDYTNSGISDGRRAAAQFELAFGGSQPYITGIYATGTQQQEDDWGDSLYERIEGLAYNENGFLYALINDSPAPGIRCFDNDGNHIGNVAGTWSYTNPEDLFSWRHYIIQVGSSSGNINFFRLTDNITAEDASSFSSTIIDSEPWPVFSDDDQYCFLSHEDGMCVIDVSNIDTVSVDDSNIVYATEEVYIDGNRHTLDFDWCALRNNILYCSGRSYDSSPADDDHRGIFCFDVTDPTNPIFFYALNDADLFNGFDMKGVVKDNYLFLLTNPAAAADEYILTIDLDGTTGIGHAGEGKVFAPGNITSKGSVIAERQVETPLLTSPTDEDLDIIPNGIGRLNLQGLVWPNADGAKRQVITTDGVGNLYFSTPSTADPLVVHGSISGLQYAYTCIEVSGGFAYIHTNQSGNARIRKYDLSDPASPVFVTEGAAQDFVAPIRAFLNGTDIWFTNTNSTEDKILVYDAVTLALTEITNGGFNDSYSVAFSSTHAFSLHSGNELFVTDLATNQYVINLALPALGIICAVSADENYLFIGYGSSNPVFGVIDISNPAAPSIVTGITLTNMNYVYGLILDGDYVYLGDTSGTFATVDVSTPTAPVEAAVLDDPDITDFKHFAKEGQYIYGTDLDSDALHQIDVLDPLNPVLVQSLFDPTNLNNPYQLTVSNGFAYVATYQRGFTVVKVSGGSGGGGDPLTAAEIKILYESNPNTNEFSDAEKAKLAGIEDGATGDMTGAEIKALYEVELKAFTDAQFDKLAGIEDGATGDLTNGEVKTLYESNPNTNAFTDAEKTKLAGLEDGSTGDMTGAEIKALYEQEPMAFTDAQFTKLGTIEDGAEVNPTAGEIKTLYESNSDTNAFTDAEKAKLATVEEGADVSPAPLTAAEIKVLYESNTDTNAFTNAEQSKLAGIEDGAQVNPNAGAIKVLYESNPNTNAFTDAEKSKLAAIEDGAEANPDAAEIKTLYESNADTNAFTDAEQTKLAGITSLGSGDIITTAERDQIQTNKDDIAALETGMLRQQAVLDVATSTAAPPTEVLGDRYILSGDGAPHADWDGAAQQDIVEFDGAVWQADTPLEGWITFVFALDVDALFTQGQWEPRTVAVNSHQDLADLQGGTTAEYYHTTAAEYAKVQAIEEVYTGAEKTKLAGIEDGATGDLTAGEVKTLYESNPNTNAFDDAAVAKLAGIEDGATGDLTAGEIKTLYESNANTNEFSDAEQSKLAGIEDGATGDMTGAEIKVLYEAEPNAYTDAKDAKLATIETGATADQTAGEIKTLYESNADTNAFTDAEKAKLAGISEGAEPNPDPLTAAEIKVLYESNPDTNAFTDTEKSKLAGIEDGATGDMTGAEIKALYEVEPKAFTDAQFDKLAGIEDNATADQTAGEIKTLYESNADTNAFTDAEKTKLANIEDGATGGITDVDGEDYLQLAPDAGLVFRGLEGSPTVQNGIGGLTVESTDSYYILNPHTQLWEEFGPGEPLWMDGWLHYAPARTNSQPYSRDLTGYTKIATPTVSYDQVGLLGEPNTASLVADDNAGGLEYIYSDVTVPADTRTYVTRYFVLKDNDETRFPDLQAAIIGTNPAQYIACALNTKTGEFVERNSRGTGRVEVNDAGLWWEVLCEILNDGVNTSGRTFVAPARGTFLGEDTTAAVGSVVIGQAEFHEGVTLAQIRGTPPIFTNGAASSVARIKYTFDQDNHQNDRGGWYCEVVLGQKQGDMIYNTNGIISSRNGSTAGVLYWHNNKDVFATYDGATVGFTYQMADWEPDKVHKIGTVYSADLGLMNIRADTVEFQVSDAIYDGAYDIDAGEIELFAGSVHPQKIRNVRRYDLAYGDAKAAIDNVIASGGSDTLLALPIEPRHLLTDTPVAVDMVLVGTGADEYDFVPKSNLDLTAAEIKVLYESNADTNAFTDAEQAKLAGIEEGATAGTTSVEGEDYLYLAPEEDLVFRAIENGPIVQDGVGDVVLNSPETYYVLNPQTKVWDTFLPGVPLWMDGWLIYQPTVTNSVQESNLNGTFGWGVANSATYVGGQAGGMTGAANLMRFTDATATGGAVYNNTTIPNDSREYTARWFVKKPSAPVDYAARLTVNITSGGNLQRLQVGLNTNNGDHTIHGQLGSAEAEVIVRGDWIEVLIQVANDSSGNTILQAHTAPSYAGLDFVYDDSKQGSVEVGVLEVHEGKKLGQIRGSSPVFTSGAAVTLTRTEYQFDMLNNAHAQGVWYIEWSPGMAGAEISTTLPHTGILSTHNETNNAGQMYTSYDNPRRFATYDGSSAHDTGTNNDWAANATIRVAVAYDAVAALKSIIDGGAMVISEGSYDGSYGETLGFITIGLINTKAEKDMPQRFRRLRRYDVDYSVGKPLITQLVTHGPTSGTLIAEPIEVHNIEDTDKTGNGGMLVTAIEADPRTPNDFVVWDQNGNAVSAGLRELFEEHWVPAEQIQPAEYNGAGEPVTRSAGVGMTDVHGVPFSVEQEAHFYTRLPVNWIGGGLSCKFHWTPENGGAENVNWGVAALVVQNDVSLDQVMNSPAVVGDSSIADRRLHITDDSGEISLVGELDGVNREAFFKVSRRPGKAERQRALLQGVQVLWSSVERLMLDAQFSEYTGVREQALVNGTQIGVTQGVQVGEITVNGTHWSVSGDRVVNSVTTESIVNILQILPAGYYDRGNWMKAKFRYGATADADSRLGAFNSATLTDLTTVRQNVSTGEVEYYDGSAWVGSGIVKGVGTDIEFLVITETAPADSYFLYIKDADWEFVAVTAGLAGTGSTFVVHSDLGIIEVDQIDTGYDAGVVLNTRGPELMTAPLTDFGSAITIAQQVSFESASLEKIASGWDGVFMYTPTVVGEWYEFSFTVDAMPSGTDWEGAIFSGGGGGLAYERITSPGPYKVIAQETEVGVYSGPWFVNAAGAANAVPLVVSNMSHKKITAPSLDIENLRGDAASASFGPADDGFNTLVLNDLDELHDDYPANGVGKIRRGSVAYRDGAVTEPLVISGGVADFTGDGDAGRNLTQIDSGGNPAGLSVISRALMKTYWPYPLRVSDVSLNFGSPAEIHGQITSSAVGTMRIYMSDGAAWVETIDVAVPEPVGFYREYNMVMGGYNASGEPDPAGTNGALVRYEGVLKYSSALARHTPEIFAGVSCGAAVERTLIVDSLQTKIDLAALATPQRALFNDTFRPVGGEEIVYGDAEWTPAGDPGAYDISGGVMTVDGTQTASHDVTNSGTVEAGKSYEVTWEILTRTTGTVALRIGTTLTSTPSAPGIYTEIVASAGTGIAIRPNATFAGSVNLLNVSVIEVGAPHLDAYLPENGVPFIDFGTGGGMIVENGQAKSADGVHYGMFSNPGGSFWEMECEVGHANFAAAYICVRWIPGWGPWYGDGFIVGLWHNAGSVSARILEYVGGSFQIRANTVSSMTATGAKRIIVTDDGETLSLIIPETGEVFSYTTTVYAEEVGCGIQSAGVGTDVGYINWYAARTGTVLASAPVLTNEPGDVTVEASSTYDYSQHFSGSDLVYSISSLPAGASFDRQTGILTAGTTVVTTTGVVVGARNAQGTASTAAHSVIIEAPHYLKATFHRYGAAGPLVLNHDDILDDTGTAVAQIDKGSLTCEVSETVGNTHTLEDEQWKKDGPNRDGIGTTDRIQSYPGLVGVVGFVKQSGLASTNFTIIGSSTSSRSYVLNAGTRRGWNMQEDATKYQLLVKTGDVGTYLDITAVADATVVPLYIVRGGFNASGEPDPNPVTATQGMMWAYEINGKYCVFHTRPDVASENVYFNFGATLDGQKRDSMRVFNDPSFLATPQRALFNEDAANLADYVPDDGVPFTMARGTMEVGSGVMSPSSGSASDWSHMVYDNPGGTFWEANIACQAHNFYSAGLMFRWQDVSNFWRIEFRDSGAATYSLNLYEITAGSNLLRGTTDTGIASGENNYAQLMAADNGDMVTAIAPANADYVNYASTAGNDRTVCGVECRAGVNNLNTNVDWYAARTGTVAEHTP